MNSPRFPWTNLWTLAASGAGIWVIGSDIRSSTIGNHLNMATSVFPLVVLGFAFLVALWQIVLASSNDEEAQPRNVEDPGRFYLRALKLLGSQKWLRTLFICMACVNVANYITEILQLHWLRPDRVILHPNLNKSLGEWIRETLPRLVATNVTGSPATLIPRMSLTSGEGIIIYLVLGISALVAISFATRRNVPSDLQARKVLRNTLCLIALLALTKASVGGYSIYKTSATRSSAGYSAIASSQVQPITRTSENGGQFRHRPTGPAGPAGMPLMNGLLFVLWYPTIRVLFVSLMMGGIFGTLKRQRIGILTTTSTFTEDAARYFAPLALVYLVVWLADPRYFVSFWLNGMNAFSYIVPLLLFLAPCVAVLGNLRGWESIKAGVRLWRSKAKEVLPFAAFGISLCTIRIVLSVIESVIGFHNAPYSTAETIVIGTVYTLVMTFVGVIVTLAVWELSTELIAAPESAEN